MTQTAATSHLPRPLLRHAALAALTLCELLAHGYHPFVEDGGLYVTGVQSALNPSLFPHDLPFATATRHYSLFAPLMAALVRDLHIPLMWLLLLTYLLGAWLMLYAAWRIAAQCFAFETASLHAVALLTVWFALPIAGTSLFLMDPYVSARTLSTPLSLLAIGFALRFRPNPAASGEANNSPLWPCGFALAAAALFHPLMATYAASLVLALLIARLRTRRAQIYGWVFLTASAIVIAAALQATAPAESAATIAAAFSRYYWFLSQWQWFELLGLAGPLLVFAFLMRFPRHNRSEPITALCGASITVGGIATLVSVLFAHQHFSTHLVARLQPLRAFLLPYALMIVLLGGTLAEQWIKRSASHRSSSMPWHLRLAPPLLLAGVACVMVLQGQAFPASQHLELPWRAPTNPWSQAFIWARNNTPADALFALDANYITTPGEDGQTFRATAQRSMLPDYSKDGGEAAIRPALAAAWLAGVHAQSNLSVLNDAERDARLKPLAVTWLLLQSSAPTSHHCAYDNGTVKVCRLGP